MLVRTQMTPHPFVVSPECDFKSALRLMQEHGIHHLPVLDRQGALAGVLAERDLLLAALNYTDSSVEVADLMHRDVVTVRADAPVTHAATLMAKHTIGGLPVVERDGSVIGVITETDIFRTLVAVLESKTARASDGAADSVLAPAAPAVVKVGQRTPGSHAQAMDAKPAAKRKTAAKPAHGQRR